MRKIIFLLNLFFLSVTIFPQNTTPEILLEQLLDAQGDDYISICNKLSYEYISYDNLNSIKYAKKALDNNKKEDAEKLISLLLYGINEIFLSYESRSNSIEEAENLYKIKFRENNLLVGYYKYFMGHVSFGSEDYAKALELLYDANIHFKEEANEDMANISLISVSSLYINLAKYKSGLAILEEPYRYFKENNNWKYQIHVLNSMASLKYFSGEVLEAENLNSEALELSRNRYPWMLPKVRNIVANFYLTKGDSDRAYELYEESIKDMDNIPKNELAFALNNMSYISISRGDYDIAIDQLLTFFDLELDNKLLKDYSNNALGNIYIIKGEYDNAEEHLLTCWESIKDDNYSWLTKDNLTYLSNLYIKKSDYKEAYKFQQLLLDKYFNFTQSQDYVDLINREEEISFDLKSMEIEAIMELESYKRKTLIIVITLLLALIFVIYRYLKNIKKDKDLFEKLSKTDYLTKLFNRRTFMEMAEKEILRSIRYKSIFSIVLLDIDDFKGFNDSYGHKCGDDVLKQVSKVLLNSCRNVDVLARWGGEEFILLFPETGSKGALKMAERVRKNVEDTELLYNGIKLKLTITLGLCEYSGNISLEEIINRADLALIRGKSQGKNRVLI